jgi:glycerol-3-phosphate acyltransferase PlsX
VKYAHRELAAAQGINFIGNVEGRDVPMGACDRGPVDVVVCDGFVGNVLLKFYESVPKLILGLLARSGVTREQLAVALQGLDYAAHGGAPLLGVKGVSIICHGKSSPEAIKNAILVGLRTAVSRMSDHIGQRLASTAAGSPT